MTPEEINAVMESSSGKLTDDQCRWIVHWAMGYLRFATDIEATRQAYFTEIRNYLLKGASK